MKHSSSRQYVFLGLSITSAWGNGHATTYRGLIKELAKRGHAVTFLERDVPWYADNREFDSLPYCTVNLYSTLDELKERFGTLVRAADVVTVGSYVPEGTGVGQWVQSVATGATAFYDIDTPVTLASLAAGKCDYLSRELIPEYDIYLSFTGGPTLEFIEERLGSPCAVPLYCSVDPSLYFPAKRRKRWDLAYLGTYAADRQPMLDELLVSVARSNLRRKFAVAGPQYPHDLSWPANVDRIAHVSASEHKDFYNSQVFTLNVTRQDMIRAGYSPSVRLFEAAACGVPILTDPWPGLEEFFEPGSEIIPVRSSAEVDASLRMPADKRLAIADRARSRTLRQHTASVRAEEFDEYVAECLERRSGRKRRESVFLRRPATVTALI